MAEVFLERLSRPEAETRLKATHLAVLAPGSVEQHGPHLPLGTDAFAAQALAEEVARKLNTVVDIRTTAGESAVAKLTESASGRRYMQAGG